MIKTYSKARDGDKKLSDSFRVREFACKDGSDKVIIDDALVEYLQRIRNWAGAPLVISSGYRTRTYNAKIGGANQSKHVLGMAADVYVKDRIKSILEIARFAETIGIKGIECNEDKNYVHLDTRTKKWFCYYRGKRYIDTSTFGGRCSYTEPCKNLKLSSTGKDVRWLQWWLRLWDYNVSIDGSFGNKTRDAVCDVQRRRGLKVDGIVGEKTRAALKGY